MQRKAAPRAWEVVVDGAPYVLFEWPCEAPFDAASLTDAERDVLSGILNGESNAEIARRRRSRPRTVANQVASIFRKLGVSSRLELIARAGAGEDPEG